jgi:hypothetical protein
MNQGNERTEMEPEYNIRGGVRGKYFERYQEMVAAKVQVEEAFWIQPGVSASRGEHSRHSTLHISVDPAYQTRMPLTEATNLAAA